MWTEMEVLVSLAHGLATGAKPTFIWSYFNKGGFLVLFMRTLLLSMAGDGKRCIDVSCPLDKHSGQASLSESHE